MEQKKHVSSKKRNRVERTRRTKAKNNRIIRQRIAAAVTAAVVVIVLLILLVCRMLGVFDRIPDVSNLALTEDGKVVCQEVSDFSEDNYTKSALKSYMKQEIKTYTDANGTDRIHLDKVKTDKETAYAKVTYASAEDYAAFTGTTLYAGTVKDAAEQGYDFADAFVSVKDGEKGESAEPLDITSQKKLKIVIIKQNIQVTVDGEILYVSDACTTMEDADTVTIAQPDGNEDAAQLTYIIYK